LCDSDSLDKEIQHLKETLRKHGYSNHDIRQALQKKDKPRPKQERLTTVARLPYQGATSHKVSRLVAKYNIQTVYIPAKNIHLLRPVKDKLGLKAAGIYCIPCECGKVYVGQTGRTIKARLKEHRRHVCLNQPEKSAVAEHSITSHHINFDGTTKLGKATKYMDRVVKEAIEIWLHPDNFKRDDGFNLSHTWRPIINMLQPPRSAPMAKQGQAQVENQLHPPAHRQGLYS
jgi:predicted GIY-YIG superfamily endonuclease